METRPERDRSRELTRNAERAPQREHRPDVDSEAPGHEWEHERTTGAQQRPGEHSWEASPRGPERRHGAHGSAHADELGGPADDAGRSPEGGPGSFGERSYAGYGDWSADRPDDQRMVGWRSDRRQAGHDSEDDASSPSHVRESDPAAERRGPVQARAGRYAGRGPRGYRRSDERIHEDVCDLLLADGEVDASDIEVAVTSGEVTLAGTVPERGMKRAAEDLTETVHGVVHVANRLRIRSATPTGAVDSSGRRVI